MKTVQVADIVKEFSLEVLAGKSNLDRKIDQARPHRPGLEFIGYLIISRWKKYKFSEKRKSPI